MDHKVPLCPVCHPPSNASPRKKKRKKASKKKAKGQWDSDVSDESDGPEFPTGIMKVRWLPMSKALRIDVQILYSLISLSLARNCQMCSTSHLR